MLRVELALCVDLFGIIHPLVGFMLALFCPLLGARFDLLTLLAQSILGSMEYTPSVIGFLFRH